MQMTIDAQAERIKALETFPEKAVCPITQSAINFIPLLHQQSLIIRICTKVIPIMFDDNKLPVSNKSTTGVDHFTRSGGVYGLPGPAANIHALVLGA